MTAKLPFAICAAEGCERPRKSREWCRSHYEQWRRSAKTIVPTGRFPDRQPRDVAVCSVAGCDHKVEARGWCHGHYQWWRTNGKNKVPTHTLGAQLPPHPCSVEGCERRAESRGWCSSHYTQWRTGREISGPFTETEVDRFWLKVNRDGPVSEHRPDLGRCWLWTNVLDSKGYGRWSPSKHTIDEQMAHRRAYVLFIGPIPDGLELDHLCRVRNCVNPSHLEPVTHRENSLRGFSPFAINARKTHCINGHEFTPENTEITPDGYRACHICHLASARRSYLRSRGVA